MILHSKPWISKEDIEAVNNSLKNGMIGQGDMVANFEENISNYIGTQDTVITGSGTEALILALLALEIGVGDEVILPTYVCHSVADAIIAVGATPVFCDSGQYWVVTPEAVLEKISSKTKAIIVVHIYSIMADIELFLGFGLPIIEDCCQAFGANNGISMAGSKGIISVFSFHATKCLTTGEGGAVTSSDQLIMDKIRSIKVCFIQELPISRPP